MSVSATDSSVCAFFPLEAVEARVAMAVVAAETFVTFVVFLGAAVLSVFLALVAGASEVDLMASTMSLAVISAEALGLPISTSLSLAVGGGQVGG